MKRSRVLVSVLMAVALGMILPERVRSQASPRMWADTLLELTTDEIPRPTLVQVKHDHWEPGAETGRHQHPGPAVFVVIEGELEEILHDGATRTLEAGRVYWKPPRVEHNVRNVTDRMARAVVVHLDPAPAR
jgi:quercetin dioxygenase-like cupin family protein